jgi:type 1 glutamine amidotransferase
MIRFSAPQFVVWFALLMVWAIAQTRAAEPPAKDAGDAETLVPVPESLLEDMPPPRTRAEVEAVLQGADEKAETRPIHVVLVAGKKDHGPGEHDYPAWQKAWAKLLARAEKTRVTAAWEKPSPEDFKSADVMVLFKHTAWPKELNQDFDGYFARGGGVVIVHFAVDAGDNPQGVEERIGPFWGGGAKYRHGTVDLSFDAGAKHPIVRGFAGKTVRFHDETYWRLTGDASRIEVLASAEEKGEPKPIPLLWSRETGKGRVHANILGHYNWTFNDPLFRILLLRAIAWTAKEPVDRFNRLATVGVRLKE